MSDFLTDFLTDQQGGILEDLDSVQMWSQLSAPANSYKIQLGYLEIPKTVPYDEKWLDTPYRFQSFHDAAQEGDRIFKGYTTRIVGSNDSPYWDAPSYLRQEKSLISNRQWYDVVGVKPLHDNPYSQEAMAPKPPQLSQTAQRSSKALSKLNRSKGQGQNQDEDQAGDQA